MNDEEFKSASLSPAPRRKPASRNHRNTEIEWINVNRHGVARPIGERLRAEVRRPLVGHALREITEVRRVVGAKNATELVAHGKQIVVISQIRQKLLSRGIRGDIRQDGV